jgi:transposase
MRLSVKMGYIIKFSALLLVVIMLYFIMFKEVDKSLPDNVLELQEMVVSITKKAQKESQRLEGVEQENEFLREQLRLIRLKLYARLSERYQEETNDIGNLLFEDIRSMEAEQEESPEDLTIKEHKCGSEKSRIGEETCEKLQIEPAKLWVEKHIRPKYACRKCEGVEDEGKTVSIAPMPPSMIPKSITTPSLLTHIFISKFCDALPFYRQEQQFKRYGIEINRSNMCNWAMKVSDRLKPLLEMLRLWILSGPLINIDETTVQVLNEPGRKPQSKSYSWVFLGGEPGMPGLYYHYAPSRSGKIAEEFLSDYQGYVQTDGYAGYNFLDSKQGIAHCGCWAHVRRKFNDVVKAAGSKNMRKGKANHALSLIRNLYLIEREAKNKGYTEEQILSIRKERSKPIIDEFEIWLKEHAPVIPPQSLLGKAFGYTLSQWPRLVKYLDNGLVRMDNNLIENAIRPFVIGRKNWLFSVSQEGARASASFYSLIETAKANDLEPYKYLKYLFGKFPFAKTSEDIFNLLPMNVHNVDLKK